MDILTVEHLFKNYENEPLLKDLSLEVKSGELLCLLGRSGSGKSTLLRIITGIESPDGGRIMWNGQDLAGVPTHKREFGLMFQDFALFPHLNVEENVAFGLRLQHLSEQMVAERVKAALDQVNMTALARRRVTDLSGGEQQRVALARSLAPRPRLLLLDEPLGALDRALRGQMQQELRDQLRRTGIPAIYVTHDQEEALALSDRIALLHEGRIEQAGIASEVYDRPVSCWVAEFLGMTNFLPGEVVANDPLAVKTRHGIFHPVSHNHVPLGAKGTLLIKPYGADIKPTSEGGDTLNGRVDSCIFQVDHFTLRLDIGSKEFFTFSINAPLAENESVALQIPPASLLWFGDGQ